ncbi:MAG TPA: hypothetical protein DCM04_02575 [Saprospirales bacterium]|nr:hypothetical protein [Saprospirales bacterium]|tara:strand:- start:30104 stop:30388 length:285 start_codon:yes stop_codon:yes gene_type:complete
MKILKSKVAGMTDLQYTKRYNLIKQICKRRELEAARDKEMIREEKALKRQLKKEGFSSDQENINQWTDGPQYLKEHYGERLADQTSYESDEGWN